MFELLEPPATARPAALLDEVRSAARAETRAAAQRLSAIWQLYRIRLRQHVAAETWAFDTSDEVAGEVAAAQGTSLGLAHSYLRFARAMHERLPLLGMVLSAGNIDYRLFQTVVYRTDLITDADTLALVDGQLASRASRWTSLSQGKLAREVDRIIAKADQDAVRRRRERVDERDVSVTDCGDGLACVYGTVSATDGHLLAQRLEALAATVCSEDPRTVNQRRSDAIGPLAAGADSIGCQCGDPDCAAPKKRASNIVVHVIADQATVEGRSDAPGYLVGGDDLIPADLVAELAASAKVRPLFNPLDAPPEPGYAPSAKLAEFIRCRDLTCRAPGCDVPASQCDIDHVIPYDDGGLTHASNMSCKCR
jgi:hypothetical protein